MLDHLVYAVPDLAEGRAALAARLGVVPATGGRHPGWGTANALLSLGPDTYLEIIGPDPERAGAARPRLFGLDRLTAPRLAGWAAKAPDLEARVRHSRQRGYNPGPVRPGRRLRPDGTALAWRLALPPSGQLPYDGLIPFLIDWKGTEHPATTTPLAGRLVAFYAEHPSPEAPRRLLAALGVPFTVEAGPAPRLIAEIETPGGRVRL